MHLRLGEALAPLRQEGYAVLGSGFTFHNTLPMRAVLRDGSPPDPVFVAAAKVGLECLPDIMLHGCL